MFTQASVKRYLLFPPNFLSKLLKHLRTTKVFISICLNRLTKSIRTILNLRLPRLFATGSLYVQQIAYDHQEAWE